MEEFVGALKRPRKAMIMVKAGAPVDAVIGQLAPLSEKGDVIIDGGNSLFTDTQRRCKDLEGRGLHFVGCGVSGGEEGALKGPSLMPGGSRESWEIIAPIFRKIAAQVDGEPCCRYMGPDGAGHYVKMVHNGIEYGDMQLICEAYAILKHVARIERRRARRHFRRVEQGRARQLSHRDHRADFSQDRSRHRQAAGRCHPRQGRAKRDRHVDVAIGHSRNRSSSPRSTPRSKRASFPRAKTSAWPRRRSCRSPSPKIQRAIGTSLIAAVHDALYASKIVSYAQGMELLGAASTDLQMESEFRRHRHDLARRLHHSREISESHHRSLRARSGTAQSPSRSLFHGHHREDAGELARCGLGRGRSRRGGAGIQRFSRLFRQLSLGAVARESAPGAARLFRRAHLRTDR